MNKRLWVRISYCVIPAALVVLPALPAQSEAGGSAQGLAGEYSVVEESKEELVSSESIRELARLHYARARKYYRKGEYSEAKAEFREVLKLNPDHQGARWYLAALRKESARPAKASRGRLTKKRKGRSLKTTLDSIEQRKIEIEGGLHAEVSRRKHLEKEEARLLSQLREYRDEAKAKEKQGRVNARRITQLQREKGRLEHELEKYEQTLERQKQRIEQVQRKSEQEKSVRLKEVEAQRQKLASQLKQLRRGQQAQLEGELREYKHSLQDKFDRKLQDLNRKIQAYEAKIRQYAAKLQQVEDGSRQLEEAETEREETKAELTRLRQRQQAQLKAELEKFKQLLQDKFARKEAELDEKIKAYETKVEELEKVQISRSQEEPYEVSEPGEVSEAKKKLVQVGRAERELFELQMQINQQLRVQLDEFKKEKARSFYEQGLAQLKDDKYVSAKESLEKAVSIYPDYTRAKKALIDVENQEKVDLHLIDGKYFYKNGDYQKARERFNRVLKLDYKNRDARSYLYKVEREIERKKQAEVLAKQREQDRREKERAYLAQKQRKAKQRAILQARKELKEKQAHLKKEQERKAEEERLARLKAEKEERLTRLKAEKEERLRLKKETEEKRRQEACLRKEQKLKAEERRREQARKAKEEKLARLKAEKEEKLACLQAEKEERLRLKKETEEKRRQEARLRKEQKLKAEERRREQARQIAQEEHLVKEKTPLAEKQRRAEQRAVIRARKKVEKEQERKAKEERLTGLKAEREELLRLKGLKDEAEAGRREQARLKKEQARLKKEQVRKAREEKLARIKVEREEKLARLKAEKEERLARLKAEKEERLRLKKEAEEKRREQTRLKKEQERKARQERLARLKAEEAERLARLKAEEKSRQKVLQRKVELHYGRGKRHFQNKDYIAARKEFKDILSLDPKNKYALNALEKVKATEAREQREYDRQQREECLRLEKEAEEKRREQARLKKEQECKAKEERLARLKAEREERLRLKDEAEAKRREQARLKKEQVRKAREEKLARIKVEREEKLARLKAEKEERLTRLKAEKEERLRLKKETEEKRRQEACLRKEQKLKAEERRREQARLKQEQERRAREEKLAELKAAKEERLKKEAQARKRKKQLRLHFAQGKFHYYREDYEQAVKEFEQVALIDPDYPSLGDYVRKCQKGINKQGEKLFQARKKRAKGLEKAAKHIKEEKEEEKLKKITELYKKGRTYFRHGQYLEAIACFEKVVELEGNPCIRYTPQAKGLIEQAKTRIEEKKKTDARQIAEEEVRRRQAQEEQELSAAIRNHYKLGKAHYRQGNYPMAIAEFNKIEEINPQHSLVSYAEKYISKCRRKIMQREETQLKAGMKRETQALGRGVISCKDLLTQARWYYKRTDYEQAVKVCRAALELDPLNKKALDLLHSAELKQIKREQKQAVEEVALDEKAMLSEVAKTQVIPEEKVVSVRERKFIPIVKIPPLREKLKKPITVDFRDVDLSYVLSFLADSCGVNIIPASGVSLEGKKVVIRMRDIPAENVLKYILKNQGLTFRIEEDVVWVASPSEMDKEEVESRVYFLNRGSGMFTEFTRTVSTGTGLGGAASITKVTTVKDILEEAVDWPKNSKLVLDERTGALIIANTPANLQIIEELLYNLDITPIQVLIEARFVELQVTDVKQLGIEWQTNEAWGLARRQEDNITQLESGAGLDFTSFGRATEGLNFTYSGVLTYPQFQMVLHALSETQNAKTLSAPRVTTLNNQMATIKVVDEWIYPTRYEFQVVQSDINGDGDFDDANETKYQNVPVDFVTKDVGILLHVTPNVGADEKTITLALVPEVSEGTAGYFSYAGSVSLPKFSSRTLSTSVVVNNGDTVVLGGLVKETTTKTITKVPLLGDIPILGYFFRKKNDSIVRKNLLIFVTGSIISPSGEKIETVQQQ